MHGLQKPTANTTIPALRAEAADIHKRAQALTAERATLALPSILGDSKAKQRIVDIDDERTVLAARVETIEAAIRTLQKTEQQQSWRKLLPQMERSLHAALGDQYHRWTYRLGRLTRDGKQSRTSLMLGRQPHDLVELRAALAELERLERDTAREIANRVLPEARMPFYRDSDHADHKRARAEHAKLIEQRNQHVAEALAEMLASNNLKRPAALTEAIERAQRQRVAVGG